MNFTGSRFLSVALICAGVCTAGAAFAQTGAPRSAEDRSGIPDSYDGPVSAVAAIIDDKVITTFDVEQRMRLMMIASGGRVTEQMLPQLQQQAVADLIDERLKLAEAKKYDLVPDKGEIDSEIRAMAAEGGVTFDQLTATLAADGISVDALRNQIEAGIVWPRLVQGRYGKRIRVSDDEIEATLQRMRDDATQEQFLVSEICIPVPERAQAQAFYEGGLQLIEQMRRGVPFAVVAQQFSGCTTAAAGGDLGWVRAGEMPPELDEALRALPPGSVTNPIASDGAFMILAVRDKRAAVVAGEKTWTLAYAGAPLSIGRAAARQALEQLPSAAACSERAVRRDLGPEIGVSLIENATLSNVDERFRDAIAALDRGQLSPIIEADDALHAVFVCELDEGLGIPSRATIEDRLYGRQLQRISQQYLRDVERKSLVDNRLRSAAQQAQRRAANNG